jgi:hypothetical protein
MWDVLFLALKERYRLLLFSANKCGVSVEKLQLAQFPIHFISQDPHLHSEGGVNWPAGS